MVRTGDRQALAAADAAIPTLDNDALIIRLLFTINHLSRWLTPIHGQMVLNRSRRIGEPSVKELLLRLRHEELRILPKLHAIATRTNPDLDKLPLGERTAKEEAWDRRASTIEVLAEFRRFRLSSTSLLRSLPDDAWSRVGISRREHDWTPRRLGEHLLRHDLDVLAEIDRVLDASGVRHGITAASRVNLGALLSLNPAALAPTRTDG